MLILYDLDHAGVLQFVKEKQVQTECMGGVSEYCNSIYMVSKRVLSVLMIKYLCNIIRLWFGIISALDIRSLLLKLATVQA